MTHFQLWYVHHCKQFYNILLLDKNVHFTDGDDLPNFFYLYIQFLNLSLENNQNNPFVGQLKHLASKVLFALSLNNFTAVFNRISARWVIVVNHWLYKKVVVMLTTIWIYCMSIKVYLLIRIKDFVFIEIVFDANRLASLSSCNDDTSDYTDLELIQHINVDCIRLTKLLTGTGVCACVRGCVCVNLNCRLCTLYTNLTAEWSLNFIDFI